MRSDWSQVPLPRMRSTFGVWIVSSSMIWPHGNYLWLSCQKNASFGDALHSWLPRTVDLDLPTYVQVDCTCGRGRLALTMVQDGQAKSLSLPAHDNTLVPMVLTGFAHGPDVFLWRQVWGFSLLIWIPSVSQRCAKKVATKKVSPTWAYALQVTRVEE